MRRGNPTTRPRIRRREEERRAVVRVTETLLGRVYRCQNCNFSTEHAIELLVIKRYWERVAPDEPEPAGECPECGALCHEDQA